MASIPKDQEDASTLGRTPVSDMQEQFVSGKKRDKPSDDSGDLDSDTEDGHGDNGDNNEKTAMSRERNREHARRTRVRKKAYVQTLRDHITELEKESSQLEAAVTNIQLANILVDMGVPATEQQGAPDSTRQPGMGGVSGSKGAASLPASVSSAMALLSNKRTTTQWSPMAKISPRRAAAAAAALHAGGLQGDTPSGPHGGVAGGGAGGKPPGFSGQTVNWKESFVVDDATGRRCDLTQAELEGLRKERNRMHAKMTRDRKKELITGLERTIAKLEGDNLARRGVLSRALTANLGANQTNPCAQQPSPALLQQGRSAAFQQQQIAPPATSPHVPVPNTLPQPTLPAPYSDPAFHHRHMPPPGAPGSMHQLHHAGVHGYHHQQPHHHQQPFFDGAHFSPAPPPPHVHYDPALYHRPPRYNGYFFKQQQQQQPYPPFEQARPGEHAMSGYPQHPHMHPVYPASADKHTLQQQQQEEGEERKHLYTAAQAKHAPNPAGFDHMRTVRVHDRSVPGPAPARGTCVSEPPPLLGESATKLEVAGSGGTASSGVDGV